MTANQTLTLQLSNRNALSWLPASALLATVLQVAGAFVMHDANIVLTQTANFVSRRLACRHVVLVQPCLPGFFLPCM